MNRVRVCFLAVITSLASLPASAAFSTWDGVNNWSSTANWSAGIPSGTGWGALIRSGTNTIDGTSGAPNLNSVLLGWSGTAAINMTGGSLTVLGSSGDQCLAIGEGSAGTFIQSGGTVTAARVSFSRQGGAGTYNLNGGTLAAAALDKPGAGVVTLNFNGGTLQATASGTGWFASNITVNVQAGGAVLDTQGYDVGVGSPLLNGGGGLTKNGTGSLTLKGINTYPEGAAGTTVVNSGALIYNADGIQRIRAISGAGRVDFQGNPNGYYRLLNTLANAGTTTVSLATGSQPWNGTIFAEGVGQGGPGTFSTSSVLNVVSGKVDLRYNQTVAGLTGSGGYITTDGAGGSPVLTVNTAAGQSYTYSGVIGLTPDVYNLANVGFTKSGAGTQILAGNNTYTLATTVNAGKLLVHGSLAAGSAVAVNNGGTLGGTGTLNGTVTVNAGGSLAPGETNSVGTLSVSNLVMASGMKYTWKYNAVTSDLSRVLGPISLPAMATVTLTSLGGASLPAQGVLFTYGTSNTGAKDLGGWRVIGPNPGDVVTVTDDAANRRVRYAITAAAEADGVWNKASSSVATPYPWNNASNWVNGIVAGGTNRTAHFDAVDSASQMIDLGGGTRTIGQMVFNDTEPSAYGFWAFVNGTLDLRVSSGSPVIAISNANHDVGFELGTVLTGDFVKTGPGSLWLKILPTVAISNAEGKVCFYHDAITKFTTLSLSGGGDVEFLGQANGFFSFNTGYGWTGSLSYTGCTRVNLSASALWYNGTLWLEKDDVLPHATVLDMLAGKIYMRNQQINGITVAGLTGNAGTLITTDQALQKLTLDVANGVSCAYAGKIGVDAATASSTGNLVLTKKGPGTQILTGANTFVGTLAVSNGTLLVNNATGSGSGTNNSVTVAAGATLGGTGTLLSTNVTFDAAAILAPGGTNSVGTLTFGGNVSLANGSICKVDCTNSVSDMVVVGGMLTLPSIATVSLSVTGTPLPKQIILFTAGSLAGAMELGGWQARAGTRKYLVAREGSTNVVATLLPMGTLIRVK